MSNLLILGAGGFGHMVYECARQSGKYEEIAFLDDAAKDSRVIGKCVDYQIWREKFPHAVAAFGNNRMRLAWVEKLQEAGFDVPCLCHPSAIVSPSVQMEAGCFVMQRAVLNTHVKLGKGVLINSGAIVDHDSDVGDGAHVGLGSVVKANCHIAPLRKVEAGEVIFSTRRPIEGVDSRQLEDALYAFGFGNDCSYVKPFGAGHINETYAVYMAGEAGDELTYVLQRVNIVAFHRPDHVMANIFGVTEYLRKSIRAQGGNPDRETLSYIKTKSGDPYFEDDQGMPWRCYNYIADAVCHQTADDPQLMYEAGLGFGRFLRQLDGYPVDTLYETIPRFHDTESRLADFKKAVQRDVKDRARTCREEIGFVLARQADCSILMEQIRNGSLPLRVTHNDTKLNNLLFDRNGHSMCLIDLDTIMPGTALNDYGDAIRSGASTADEDEPNLEKVHFYMNLFELYTKGYLEGCGGVLTAKEREYMVWGAKLLTLECGMRFLADYLQGDVYFKTDYPTHNLVRSRTQFRLVAEMEQHFDEMGQIVRRYGEAEANA